MQIRLLHQNILCWIAAFSELEKYVALFMSEIMFDTSVFSFEHNKMQFEDWYRPYVIYQSTLPTQHKPAVDINGKIKIAKW